MSITPQTQRNNQNTNPEAHQKAGVEMTQEQWRKTHRDYKATINGQKYTLAWTSRGTSLVPVTIIE